MDTTLAFYISECKSLRNSLSESQATVAAIEVEKRGLLEMNAALRETADHLAQQLAGSPVRHTLRSRRQLRNYTGSDDSTLIMPVSIFIFYKDIHIVHFFTKKLNILLKVNLTT